MSPNIWYPRYVGKYQAKTSHLSLVEHGAYTLLLDHYYATGKPLPASAPLLHRICRAFAPEEQAAVQAVIDEFFTREADRYHNTTADEELVRRCEISEKRRKAAEIKHGKKDANAPACAPANAHTDTVTDTVKETGTGKDISAAAPKQKKRSTSLPPDWKPNERNISDAETRGYSHDRILELAEHFRDHHTAKGTTSKDWDASWRTWLANDKRFNGGAVRGKSNGHRQEPESVLAIGARIIARHKANNGFHGNGSGGMEAAPEPEHEGSDSECIDGGEFGYGPTEPGRNGSASDSASETDENPSGKRH